MSHDGPFDLVIFDCDGVLIDSEIISARMLVQELARLGVVIDLAYVARHFLGRSYPTVMATIRREFGLDLAPSFEEAYREELLAAFRRELTVMPGVTDVLDALAVPWCVATSSSPRRAEMSLELAGLRDRVGDRLFTASQVANGKPAPDLFLFAAARMGVVPDRALVIEDSLTGLRAAQAAGMQVWQFTGGSHFRVPGSAADPDPPPARRFDDFADFFQTAPALQRPT
ncbi:HAD family hydrolase [Tabrizicola aquatica]|uniref:HAD family hydrolase n=1 Tax=Tabrizicola aquatica TaxID=909926 RepID=UPI000CD09E34|nr:HAD family hydrolase [Tabrizicola aquatica]